MSQLDNLTEPKLAEHPGLRLGLFVETTAGGLCDKLWAICATQQQAELLGRHHVNEYGGPSQIRPVILQDESDLWPQTDEEREVGQAALRVIFQIIREVRESKDHYPYEWAEKTLQEHMEHAFEHCRLDLRELLHPSSVMLQNKKDPDPNEDNAGHALGRLALHAALKARRGAKK